MAFVNPNKPAGLSPVKYLNGANYDGKVNVYSILAANTNPFFIGDIVKLVSGGTATAADSHGVPAITLATTAATTIGVVVAVGANAATLLGPDGGPYVNVANLGNTNFRPSGAQTVNYYAAVSDDPNIIYEVQEGGVATNLTPSVVGRYAPFLYAAPANPTINPLSATTLNGTGAGVTGPSDLFIHSFARRIDNNFVTTPATGGGAQKWWVLLGLHTLAVRAAAV